MAYSDQPVGFLATARQEILDLANEPSTASKWPTDRMYRLIQRAFKSAVQDLNGTSENRIVARFDVSLVEGRNAYYLPCNVARILRLGIVDSETGRVRDLIVPRNFLNPCGPGITFEDAMMRLDPRWSNSTDVMRIEYVPNGDSDMHLGTFAYNATGLAHNTTTATSKVPLTTTPSEGYFDGRPNAHLGSVLRVLKADNAGTPLYPTITSALGHFPIQERVITNFENVNRLVTVSPHFDWDLSALTNATYTYEVVPRLWKPLAGMVIKRVVRDIHSAEGRPDKAAAMNALYVEDRREVRLMFDNFNARSGGSFDDDYGSVWGPWVS